jgi:galactan endo-1,6-beta-galactosidase
VEPLNEPFTNFWAADGRQEGCHFSHEAQAEVIKDTRAEMDKRGLQDMPIAASDETHTDLAISTWYSFDADVKKAVAKVNVHGYQGSGGRRDVLYDAVHKDGKELWNSEYGGPEPTGLQMAGHLDLDLRFLHPTAWCYWQVVDGGGWGLITGSRDGKTMGVGAKYYVLAQYTRHIRPGMTMLDTGETNFVAAYDAAGKKLVIVALQKGPAVAAGAARRIDLSKFAEVKGPVTRWITEPKGASRYEMHQDIKLAGKGFEAAMPADSVQTFEVDGVTMN